MKRATRVVPAILTSDPAALRTMLQQAEGFASYVQVDIMDGRFVPSRSITIQDLMSPTIKVPWEAHLMVLEPEKYLADYQKAGARRVIFHYEATQAPRDVIALARKLKVEVGLALNPETPVSAIIPLVDEIDGVLFLTVNPGFYGAKFVPEVMEKVAELRQKYPGLRIGVDGGIKESNIVEIAHYGVDAICVGSAIFMQPQPAVSYRRLQSLVDEATKG